jgi:hypothetical protein
MENFIFITFCMFSLKSYDFTVNSRYIAQILKACDFGIYSMHVIHNLFKHVIRNLFKHVALEVIQGILFTIYSSMLLGFRINLTRWLTLWWILTVLPRSSQKLGLDSLGTWAVLLWLDRILVSDQSEFG